MKRLPHSFPPAATAATAVAAAGPADALASRHVLPRPSASLRTRDVDFSELWGKLSAELLRVFRGETQQLRPEVCKELMTHVYRLCTCPCYNLPEGGSSQVPVPHVLFTSLKQLLELVAGQMMRGDVPRMTDKTLLQWYEKKWEQYERSLCFTGYVAGYLNRDFITKSMAGKVQLPESRGSAPKEVVRQLGLMVWRDQMLLKNFHSQQHTTARTLATCMYDAVNADRKRLMPSRPEPDRAASVSRNTMRVVLDSFIAVGEVQRSGDHPHRAPRPKQFYVDHFEARFVRMAESFFKAEMQQLLDKPEPARIASYMMHVEERISQEIERARACMDASTERLIRRTLVKVAVEDQANILIDVAPLWFDCGHVEEQKRLFRLLHKTEKGLEPLRKLIEDRIDADGKAAVEKAKEDGLSGYANALSSVMEKYTEVVKTVFDSHRDFELALAVGCRRYINKNALSTADGTRSASSLAKYTNQLLKANSQSSRQPQGKELEAALDKVLKLVQHLEDRDVFQQVYRNQLARRLITHSFDQQLDEEMLRKLQTVCSREFTRQLERMFMDVQVSRDMTTSFGKHCRSLSLGLPELTITVGTSGSWPLPVERQDLPEPLATMRKEFVQWYTRPDGGHSGRKLEWHTGLSTVHVRAHFAHPRPRSYDMQATVFQASVLLQFADPAVRVIPYTDMLAQTRAEQAALLSNLQSLCRFKVLSLEGREGEAVTVDGVQRCSVRVNDDFTSQARKIILLGNQRDTQGEDKESIKAVTDDRRFTIQAAIVRVMKAKQSLPHPVLVAETISELEAKFQPTPYDVKKNIEKLIEKELLERGEDGKTYVYVA